MKKNKILLILGLTIVLASCSNDNYVSKRHPEGESETQVSEEENTEKKEETKEENKDEETDTEEKTEEKTEEESSEDQDPTMDGVNYEVEDVVNIRLYPTEDSDIVGEAHPGDEILFLVESDGWSRVTVNGVSGYIRNDLLKEVE